MLSILIQKMKDSSDSLRATALCPLQSRKLIVRLREGIKKGF